MTKQPSLVGKFQGYGKQYLKRKKRWLSSYLHIHKHICACTLNYNTHTHTWLMKNENTKRCAYSSREYFVMNLILKMISFALQNIILLWKRYFINMKHWVYSCYCSHVDSSSFSWESQKCWVLFLVFWFSVFQYTFTLDSLLHIGISHLNLFSL